MAQLAFELLFSHSESVCNIKCITSVISLGDLINE